MPVKIQFKLLFFLAFLLIFIFFGLSSSKAELKWGITYKINVHTDGSSQWSVERKALLTTENDVLEWWNETAPEKLIEFEDFIKSVANSAQQSVGRNMSIGHVIGTYERTETYGIITYQFDWIGFAKVEDKKIEIGDVFNGQFINLNEDALLIVQYPEGYTFSEVKPQPIGVSISDRALSWKGPVNFGYHEPTVVLVETEGQGVNPAQNVILVSLGIAFAGMVLAGFWHFVYRKRTKTAVADMVPEGVFEIEGQEQKVVALLQRAGGSVFQSTITKEFGFSKSKTSQLLDKMEKEGIVTRQKKGREKVVTLTKNKKSQKN